MIHYDRIILNLRRAGLRNADIASKLDVSKSAVDKWCSGRTPRKWLELLDLHLDRCRDRHRPEVIGLPDATR